jgi:hypothetical protein
MRNGLKFPEKMKHHNNVSSTSTKMIQIYFNWVMLGIEVMVFNVTFNNSFSYIVSVSFIDWENHRPVANHWQTLSHNIVLSTPRHERNLNSQL